MANSELNKSVSKYVRNSNLGGSQELTPGTTPRRYEPASGTKKHNERIHRESKQMDKNGNLPFTFSKPNKSSDKIKHLQCRECGEITSVTSKFLVCKVSYECKSCNHWNSDAEEVR